MLDSRFDLAVLQLDGVNLNRDDTRAVLVAPDHEVTDLVAMAAPLRRQYSGKVGANA